jgi:hypothetical protein
VPQARRTAVTVALYVAPNAHDPVSKCPRRGLA